MIDPAQFAFQAEYRGDSPANDEFDEYLRVEAGSHPPAWQLQYGQKQIDEDLNSYNYSYVLTGDVPEARSESEAEEKVRELLDKIAERFKAVRPKSGRPLPKLNIKVWRRPQAPQAPGDRPA